jgi:hypothetical protein
MEIMLIWRYYIQVRNIKNLLFRNGYKITFNNTKDNIKLEMFVVILFNGQKLIMGQLGAF